MCAVHTLPYLSHKMVKIMFLLEYLLKCSCTKDLGQFPIQSAQILTATGLDNA